MTWFDLLVIGVVAVSAAFAGLRGATREAATLVALVVAIAAAVFGGTLLAGASSMILLFFVAGVIFLLVFLPLIFFFGSVLKQPKSGVMRRLDMIFGAIFGAARGVALVGLGYLAYSYILAENRHAPAVRDAFMLPVVRAVSNAFESLVPESARIDDDRNEVSADDSGDRARLGYEKIERDGLRDMIATLTTADAYPSAPDRPRSGRDPLNLVLPAADTVGPLAADQPRQDPQP